MRSGRKSSDQVDGAADAFASHGPSGVRRSVGPRPTPFAACMTRAGTASGMDILHLVEIASTRTRMIYRIRKRQIGQQTMATHSHRHAG